MLTVTTAESSYCCAVWLAVVIVGKHGKQARDD